MSITCTERLVTVLTGQQAKSVLLPQRDVALLWVLHTSPELQYSDARCTEALCHGS